VQLFTKQTYLFQVFFSIHLVAIKIMYINPEYQIFTSADIFIYLLYSGSFLCYVNKYFVYSIV
jgi:hypothetical protein